MKQKSTYDILGHWLKIKAQMNINVATHQLSSELPYYGFNTFGVMYSGGTYERKFREIKASDKIQYKYGIQIEEINQEGAKENYYVITEVKNDAIS